MRYSLKRQKGYLALIVALLLTTVAFGGLVTAYIYSNKAQSINYSLLSMQAYYLALSGLERAKYDITKNTLECGSINGTADFTNFTFSGAAGDFTVTGTATEAVDTLNGALTATATTIPLVSSSGFATVGSIKIDGEFINYTGISANNLTGATRGVGGTTAMAHSNGASVSENQCVLNSTGGVPSISSALTKRVVQAILLGSNLSTGGVGSSGVGSGVYQSPMIVAGAVNLGGGATIANTEVTLTSSNYPGSTIISGGPVTFGGSSQTLVSNGSGGTVVSSNKSSIKADVVQNYANVTTANLWGNFFSQPKATVQAGANQSYNSSNISGATGQTIWTNTLSLSNSTTIGSLASPVLLIVNGNLSSNGLVFYGLLYVTGSVSMNGNTTINGLFAMEGSYSSNGTTNVNYNSSVLTTLGIINSNVATHYSPVPASLQEQFA